MSIQYQTIEGHELDDMNKEIVQRGHNLSSYTIDESEVKTILLGNGFYTETGKITIKRGNVERTYPSGNHSSWPGQFAVDLANGVFD